MMQTHDAFYRDPKYRCCCNSMHVEKGAYIIAFIGALLSVLAILGYAFTLNWPMVVINLITLFTFLSIIWAQRKRNPSLYMPYLVLNGIGLFLMLANLLFLIFALIFWPGFYTDYIRDTYGGVNERHHDYAANTVVYVILITAIFFSALAFAIYAWFYSVVLHAYQYMKDVQTVNVTSVPVGIGTGVVNPVQTYHSTTIQEVQQKV